MKVTLTKHWANHSPIKVFKTKKEAMTYVRFAFYNVNTNLKMSEFIELSEIKKTEK